MKKIIITGGAGFIRSHLCEKLLKNGEDIICLDNFYTGQIANIQKFTDYKNFKLIKHDITEKISLEAEQIYNLACPASPPHYQRDAIKTTKTCVIGAINMLETAKRCNGSLLQASTSEIYGNPMVHPQNEEYWGSVNPIGIRSCYDEGKRCAETLVMNYHRQYNVSTRIIRIFNTYGPNMDINDGRVVSNFIVQALKNKDITVYGDGSQTRSFCYVSDLIDGMIKMMNNTDNFTGPVNLGNPCEKTVLELANLIIDLTGSKSKIIYKPLPGDDPVKRKPDISLAEQKLGWKPKVDIKDGLKMTIEYFEQKLKSGVL